MNNLQKYSAYKHSGVDWLGEIPEHWDVMKIKYLFKEINERSLVGEEELLSVSQYTGVTLKSDKVEEGDLLTNASTLEGYKRVKNGDLVSNIMLAWNGSLGFSPYDGITSPAYSIYRLNEYNVNGYFHYLLRTEIFKAEFKRNSSGVIESRLRLYTDDFYSIASILPPQSEQAAIATFLDQKTAKIDQAIAIKEKQIELLKERKQIIIQQAVTGKIVWDKEKNAWTKPARVKDSGVEWIGEVPEGWEVKKIKHCACKISKGTTPSTEGRSIIDEGAVRFIKAENIQNGEITEFPRHFIDKKTNEIISRSKLQINDVLFVIAGATLGKVAIVKDEHLPANTNQAISFIRPNNHNDKKYLALWLTSDFISKMIWLDAVQSAQPNLSMENLGNLPFVSPPSEEQFNILNYIESQSVKIDKAISLQEQQIEKLKEYKTVLVDAAVTGKIKVC